MVIWNQVDIQSLFNQHLCYTFDRQLLLTDIIGDLPWTYDLHSGILSFGDQFHWQAEFLGTESEETNTWLWAWANDASNIPAQQQAASLKLRALGEEHSIAEFIEPTVPLEHADGHAFASIAVGEGLGKAYYRGPYEGGAVFLLIVEKQMPWQVEHDLQRISTLFPQIISELEIKNHQLALQNYLNHYGLKPERTENTLIVREQGQRIFRASFDEFHRLQELKTSIT